MRYEEWDWPERPPTRQRRRYYQTIDVYQPSGWNSPGVRKAVDIYWRTTVFVIKALIAIPLTIMLIGSIWFLAIIVSLVV
jgi:hypothetical protein